MGKSVSSTLRTHFGLAVTTLATCWKVTRRDGTVLGFTDHDADLTIDAVQYVASSGFYRTAISNSATTAVDNLEVRGFLDNDFISENELRNGAYDFAEVEIFAVNWADLSMGICRLRYGHFGEVTIRPSGLFVVELRGLMQFLSQTVGETISPDCRADVGDERCKVKLVPDIRANGRTYAAGDRVIVPSEVLRHRVHVPILNHQFDWYQTTTYQSSNSLYNTVIAWVLTNCVVTNYPRTARTGTHYIRPTGPTGSARRVMNLADTLTGTKDVTFRFWANQFDVDWEVGAYIEFLDVTLGVTTVLTTKEIPYAPVLPLDEWVQIEDTFAVDLTNVNLIRVQARWRPSAGNPSPTDIAEVQIDDFTLHIDGYGEYSDPFLNFDQEQFGTRPALNWSSGTSHTGNVNLLPVFGDAFLTTAGTTESHQVVSLTGTGADTGEIDAGNYVAHLETYVSAFEYGATSRIRLEFRNISGTVISTAASEFEDIRPAGEWHFREFDAAVPVGTRSIRIRLGGDKTEERTGEFTPTKCFDIVTLDLVHVDSDPDEFLQYQGVEYIVTTAGVSATTVPTFTHTLGEEVTDGTVIWECVQPQYTFLAGVETVTDNFEFTLPTIDAEDDWFKWGVLTFLDGDNEGRGVEVLAWDNTTKKITLMLPARMPIASGTMIRVHSGCDKTRGIGGCKRYLNILNYRGEPEVPGTDLYFKVGGTGAQ